MKLLERALRKEDLFRNSVLFSLLFHLGLFGFIHLKNLIHFEDASPLEIDLTKPFRIGGNPLLKPGGGTTLKAVKDPAPPAPLDEPVVEKKTPPKDWVLPGPETKVIEKPVPEGAPAENRSVHGIEGGDGEGYTGTGGGFGGGDGEGGGIKLDRIPMLLNKKEILKLLKRNYPPAERESGINSQVGVFLHLDAQGNVLSVDLARSGGANFDAVAKMIAMKMRFRPAMANGGPVAVKIRQAIVFRLGEDDE